MSELQDRVYLYTANYVVVCEIQTCINSTSRNHSPFDIDAVRDNTGTIYIHQENRLRRDNETQSSRYRCRSIDNILRGHV